MKLLKVLFDRTLNSVVFGIAVMVLIAVYIAIGSGFASVRAYFEMTDIQFFNAWPLKLLMGLLVANLGVVTWVRIPFTPPRYGVWLVHSGIIVLIFGMATYYATKREGMVLIPRGQTIAHFYDGEERALFIRPSVRGAAPMPAAMVPLENLPRFGLYLMDQEGGGAALQKSGLQNIEPTIWWRRQQDAAPSEVKLSEAVNLKTPLTVDIVGYYPYGQVITKWVENDSANGVEGMVMSLNAPHLESTAELTLVAADPQSMGRTVGEAELEHRQVSDPSSLKLMELAARQMHRLSVQVGDYDQTLYVSPGEELTLGDSGYRLKVEDFNPSFPAMNGERVALLTVLVTAPDQQFRRQIIMGRDAPTDWKLDVEGAGPMGKRQTAPLDEKLKLTYTFSDPMHLCPDQASVKHTFVTHGGKGVELIAGFREPTQVLPIGAEPRKFELSLDGHPIGVEARLSNHLHRDDRVEVVPMEQRTRDASQAGSLQVVLVKLSAGDWSRVVAVPFLPYLLEHPEQWNGPIVELPGGGAAVQLQLGRTVWQLPARVTLTDFQLEHYPGGKVMGGMPRDFISTLRIEDRRTGEVMEDRAHMNHPVYWPAGIMGKTWTFFQAQWDPQGQRWTVLGVGTRHGTWIMTLGCLMMAVGLMWAFYLKPVIIRRMKAKALAAVAGKVGVNVDPARNAKPPRPREEESPVA